ncbi:hypothetical protein LOTGIDRAFT_141816, partial [Lottia gigantea]
VINGLMSRDDWQLAIKLPVGCLPGGSGNALCCAINYSAGEPVLHNLLLHSTFILIKHRVIPMDLVLIQTPTERLYSFLSVSWGIIADIDLESEKYRSIGEARFTFGALKRIIEMNVKKETEFLTAAAEENEIQIEQEVTVATKILGQPVPAPLLTSLDQPVPDNWISFEDDFVTITAVYQTHLGSDMLASPESRINDGFIYLIIIRSGISRNALLSLFMSFDEGKHVDSPDVEIIRCLAFRMEPKEGNIMVDGEHIDLSPIQGQVLPGLSRLMAIQ